MTSTLSAQDPPFTLPSSYAVLVFPPPLLFASSPTTPATPVRDCSYPPQSSLCNNDLAPPSTPPGVDSGPSATDSTFSPALKTRSVNLTNGSCDFYRQHHFPSFTSSGRIYPVCCPKNDLPVLPLTFVGTAGVGTNSRIKVHLRYGGKRMVEQHVRNCSVLMTDEYMTSKICPLCVCWDKACQSNKDRQQQQQDDPHQ